MTAPAEVTGLVPILKSSRDDTHGKPGRNFPLFLLQMSRYADNMGRWAAIALGVSIPVSVALDNLLLALVLAGWLAGGNYHEKLLIVKRNPVAVAALALFALLLVGTLYGERYPGDTLLYLGKYADLLFIPAFLWLFRHEDGRRRGLYALATSLALVLLLSYLIKFGLVPNSRWVLGDAANPSVFKHYLTHNILMALAAFIFAQLAGAARSARARWGWAALAILAVVNVTAMMQGRTGYLTLGALALYWGYSRQRWRGVLVVAAAVAALGTTLALVPGPFQDRLHQAANEIAAWQPGTAAMTSSGLRLEFYRNSLGIIAQRPLLGVGTGGFPRAYADKVRGSGMVETRNPHNEYLHIAAQIGMAGLGVLLYLFYRQWRLAAQLASPFECHLARGLVLLMVAGCMFNSLLLDHAEGLLYAWLTGLLFGGLQFKGNG